MIHNFYEILLKKFGEQHWWPAENKEEIMIGAILTQNTNWSNVEKAIKNLKAENACSIKALADMPIEKIEILIRPSGFYKQKARRLQNFCKYLLTHYGENFIECMQKKEIFELRNELLSIDGIGKETADSILLYVFERPIFVIDAYTRKMYNAIYGNTQLKYDELREIFENEIKKNCNDEAELVKIYKEYHALIVRFGKEYKRDYEKEIKNAFLHTKSEKL